MLLLACLGAVIAAIALASAALGSATAHHGGARPAVKCKLSPRRHHHSAAHGGRCHRVRRGPHSGSTSAGGAPASGRSGPGATPGASASSPGGGSSQASEPPQPPQGPPSVPHVQVTAVEFGFSLSRTTVPAGKVIVQFVNHGQDEHNLNFLSGESELAGSFANTPSHGIVQEQLELRPGTYTLFCSLPEHEQKGMKATLVVQ